MSAKQMKFDADARLSFSPAPTDCSCRGRHDGANRPPRGAAEVIRRPCGHQRRCECGSRS